MNSPRPSTIAGLGLGLLMSGIAAAQSSPSGTGPTDDAITLPEFSVSSDAGTSGYLASESTTGSRVAVKIKELPFNVNVITSEFLNDFQFFELEDDFAYASSFGGMDAGGGYNIRGFGATKALRNGFQRFGLIDKVSVDRIEIIKGPAAAIYGETRPGGLINVISKKPKTRPQQRASLTVGSYNTWRAELGSTGPVPFLKGTYYNFDAAAYERDFDQPHAFNRQQTFAGSILKKFSEGTSLFLEAEWLKRPASQINALPLVDNGTGVPATQRFTRIAYELRDFSPVGPINHANRDVSQFNGTFEHRINETWSLRAAANYFHRHNWSMTGGNGNYNPVTRQITGRTPAPGRIDEDGGGFQADLLAHYWMFDRKLENRTLLTFDYNAYFRVDPQWRIPNLAPYVASGQFAQNLSVDNPNYNVPWPFSLQDYSNINRWRDNHFYVQGAYLRHQSSAWNGRAIVAAGVRYDKVFYRLENKRFSTQSGNPALAFTRSYTDDAVTPNIGANVEVAKGIRAYANYSKSFFPDSQNVEVTAVTANQPPSATNPLAPIAPAEGGYGYDYGFKVGLLEDKLNFTIGGFYVLRTDVRVTVIDPNGVAVTVNVGEQTAQGFEFDGNWQIGDGLTLLGGYGYTDSQNTDFGRDLDALGRQSSRVPIHNAYLAVKYVGQTGRWKNFTTNLGVRYTGKTWIDTTGGAGPAGPDGFIRTNNGTRDITVPAYTVIDLGFRYALRPSDSKFRHTFGVNFKNLLDEDYINPRRQPGDRFGTYFSYTVTH